MDHTYFKPEDIENQPCSHCGQEIEFWKDDIFLICPHCQTKNTNARVGQTCLAWCKEAAACLGNADIAEWLQLYNRKNNERVGGK